MHEEPSSALYELGFLSHRHLVNNVSANPRGAADAPTTRAWGKIGF